MAKRTKSSEVHQNYIDDTTVTGKVYEEETSTNLVNTLKTKEDLLRGKPYAPKYEFHVESLNKVSEDEIKRRIELATRLEEYGIKVVTFDSFMWHLGKIYWTKALKHYLDKSKGKPDAPKYVFQLTKLGKESNNMVEDAAKDIEDTPKLDVKNLERSIKEIVTIFPKFIGRSSTYEELYLRRLQEKEATEKIRQILNYYNDEEKAYIAEGLMKIGQAEVVHLNKKDFGKIFNQKLSSAKIVSQPYPILKDIDRMERNISDSEAELSSIVNTHETHKAVADSMSMYFNFILRIANFGDSIQLLWKNEEQNYETFRAILDAYEKSKEGEERCKQFIKKILSNYDSLTKNMIALHLIDKGYGYYVYLNKEDFGARYVLDDLLINGKKNLRREKEKLREELVKIDIKHEELSNLKEKLRLKKREKNQVEEEIRKWELDGEDETTLNIQKAKLYRLAERLMTLDLEIEGLKQSKIEREQEVKEMKKCMNFSKIGRKTGKN